MLTYIQLLGIGEDLEGPEREESIFSADKSIIKAPYSWTVGNVQEWLDNRGKLHYIYCYFLYLCLILNIFFYKLRNGAIQRTVREEIDQRCAGVGAEQSYIDGIGH